MKYFVFGIAVVSLLIFNCTNVSPNDYPIAGFITFLIPVALLFNLGFFIWLLLKKNILCIIPLLVLVVGFKYIEGTFAINFNNEKETLNSFSVLSYNTSFFRKTNLNNANSELDTESESFKILKWIQENDADIKCFQEFYHQDSSALFSTLDSISQQGEYDYYFSSNNRGGKNSEFGIVIFSRYPIINSGEVLFKGGSANRAAFADIVIHKDTIRLVNTHLESMSLSTNNPLVKESLSSKKENFKTVFRKLKKGSIDRSFQAEILRELIYQSPYKVILVGDFNQTPYSYVYHSFKDILHNAFEKAGNGFGITYGGNTLFFLRIDNQFYDPLIRAIDYITHYDMPFSDHFPIEATYYVPEQ